MTTNPFDALGLPARPDLDDEQVRAAWRTLAAATHPDRPDGGDLARYTAASAAYAELRTGWGRSEAYADLAADDDGPVTTPLPAIPADPRDPAHPGDPAIGPGPSVSRWQSLLALVQVPARIRRGRPRRLLLRAVLAALLALAVLQLIPGQAAVPADIAGLIVWFTLTGRKDLAPPPER
jgi:hypothetical protein